MANKDNNKKNINNNKGENIMSNIVLKLKGHLTKLQGITCDSNTLTASKIIRKTFSENNEAVYETIGENQVIGSYVIDDHNFGLPRFTIKLTTGGYDQISASINKDKDGEYFVNGKSHEKAYSVLCNVVFGDKVEKKLAECIKNKAAFEKAKAEMTANTIAVQATKEQTDTIDTEIVGVDRFGRPIIKRKFKGGFDIESADLDKNVQILGKTYRLVVIKGLDCSKLFFEGGRLLANVNWKKEDASPKVYIKAGKTPDIGYFLMFDGHVADGWVDKKPHKAELETEAQARFLGDIFTNVVPKIAEIKGYQFPQKAIYHEPEYLNDPAYWEAAEADYVNQLPKFMKGQENNKA